MAASQPWKLPWGRKPNIKVAARYNTTTTMEATSTLSNFAVTIFRLPFRELKIRLSIPLDRSTAKTGAMTKASGTNSRNCIICSPQLLNRFSHSRVLANSGSPSSSSLCREADSSRQATVSCFPWLSSSVIFS